MNSSFSETTVSKALFIVGLGQKSNFIKNENIQGLRKQSSDREVSESSTTNSEKNESSTRKITESSEYNVTYLSKWRKVPFKIELSKDNFELEEIKPVKISQLRLTTKNSDFYTIPMANVVSCVYLKENVMGIKANLETL